ncbi:MAG: dihydroorotase [Planctomycetes bacterium]|nr:dihydroorotase [Planctomycetota bacterium]
MSARYDLIVRGGSVWAAGSIGNGASADIGVIGGRFAAIGDLRGATAASEIDARGLTVLPGVMDTQVHLREPGLEYKEDLASGTAGAALGGITAVFEMPNTKPNTDTAERLADKLARAQHRAWVDHAFYIGATAENAEGLAALEMLPGAAGVKVFMGSSTGSLLVADDATLTRVLRSGRRRVAVHCEDEQRLIERRALIPAQGAHPRMHPMWRDEMTALRATTRLLTCARAARRRVHVLHVTTAEEMELLRDHKDLATVEVLPQHLTLCAPECYERLGTYAQMNPPIREQRHQDALWKAVRDGTVDVLGSDHAPHTREEKDRPYPESPSGLTGVQTLLPLMLDHVAKGRLTLERLIDLTSAGPQRIFGIVNKGRIARGYDADLTIVDLKATRTITNQWIAAKCGWSPFDGMTVTGWPKMTVVRGRLIMRDDQLIGTAAGEPIRFVEALP